MLPLARFFRGSDLTFGGVGHLAWMSWATFLPLRFVSKTRTRRFRRGALFAQEIRRLVALGSAMIRLVINSIPTAPGGGLTNLLGLLEGWRSIDAELDVTVLASRPETVAALEKAGFGGLVHAVPMMSLPRRLWWQRVHLPRVLKALKADLVLTNTFALPSSPCPQVVHHQNLFTCFAKSLLPYARLGPKILAYTLLARRGLTKAAWNVFISDHVRECCESLVPASRTRNQTIYYGLSEHYHKAAGRVDESQRRPYHLCALQFPSGYKGNDDLLRALAELVRRAADKPWRLDIAGWGDFSAFKKLAEELGVADRVNWLGMQNTAQVAELLRRSACMVYPSKFEGFGLPLIEAFASRCPAVAVDCTAIPEVGRDAAVLVPPSSPQAIADAVLRICTDEEFRTALVANGYARSQRFSWARTARQFCHVFANVLKRPVPASPELEPVVADAVPVPH
jgi:glycosyltransferase involved in cell wall biosynthesis